MDHLADLLDHLQEAVVRGEAHSALAQNIPLGAKIALGAVFLPFAFYYFGKADSLLRAGKVSAFKCHALLGGYCIFAGFVGLIYASWSWIF